jgi:hypothetical protein
VQNAGPSVGPTSTGGVVPTPVVGMPTPRRSRPRRRLAGSLALVGAAVVLLVAITQPWWVSDLGFHGISLSINLLPGNTYTETGSDGNVTLNENQLYTNSNLTNVGYLYESILIVGIVAGAAAGAAGGLGVAGTRPVFATRRPHRIAVALAVTAAAAALVLTVGIVFLQPYAFNGDASSSPSAEGFCPTLQPNYCTSFWGSQSANGASITWGSGLGWYLGIVGAALAVAGVVLLIASRRDPFTRSEQTIAPFAPAPSSPAASPGGGAPPSAPPGTATPNPAFYTFGDTVPATPGPVQGPPCPRCGTAPVFVASANQFFCPHCRAYL